MMFSCLFEIKVWESICPFADHNYHSYFKFWCEFAFIDPIYHLHPFVILHVFPPFFATKLSLGIFRRTKIVRTTILQQYMGTFAQLIRQNVAHNTNFSTNTHTYTHIDAHQFQLYVTYDCIHLSSTSQIIKESRICL